MKLKLNPQVPEPGASGTLRAAAISLMLAATVTSVALTLYQGRHNSSLLLVTLFALWVASPFVGAVLANRVAGAWEATARKVLYVVMLILAVGSVAVYCDVVFGPPRPQSASYFLMTPLLSWLLVAMPIAVGAKGAHKR